MVSYSQLLNMDLSRLRGAASSAGGLSSSLSGRGSEVAGKAQIPGGMWSGDDANAAGSLLSPQSAPLWDVSDALSGGQGILQDLASALDSAKERLGDAKDAVAGTMATIASDGTVTVPPGLDEAENERATNAARAARDIIDEALEMAASSDEQAGSALQSNIIPGLPYPMPPNSPLSREWWRGVGRAGQQQFDSAWEGIKNHFSESTSWGGPGINGNYQESGTRKNGPRGRGGDDAGSGRGSMSWRLFQAGYNPVDYSSDNHPGYAQVGANAGISGSVGAMNSIDAGVGASAGVGVQGSQEVGAFTFNGNAGVQAGASAGLGADIGYEDGKVKLGFGGKATLGLGGTLGGSVDIDLNKLKPW